MQLARLALLSLGIPLFASDAPALRQVEFEAYLKASNTQELDHFGRSVAISGDTVVVGAAFEGSDASVANPNPLDDSAPASGAAYVFVRSGTTWSQQAFLKALNGSAGDQFGFAVAIDGDTLAVGAWLESGSSSGVNGNPLARGTNSSGAVYVFVRTGTSWTQEAYIKATPPVPGTYFGSGLSMSGNSLLVGSIQGATVLRRTNGTWSEEADLAAANTNAGDLFGAAVGLDGDVAVVGAPGEASGDPLNPANNAAPDAGAAYVFTRSGTVWSQGVYLKAPSPNPDDQFGFSVAASGDAVLVGAIQDEIPALNSLGLPLGNEVDSGSAFVFRNAGASWILESTLTPSNAASGDDFGFSVALDGDLAVIGASREDATGFDGQATGWIDAGAAYAFIRTGTSWQQSAYLQAPDLGNDWFGDDVDVDAGRVVVSAPFEDSAATGVDGDMTDNTAAWAGAAYVFEIGELLDLTVSYCSGDGGDQAGCTPCPCSNDAPAGTVGGCLNSVGTSARLHPGGSQSLATGDLRFEASGVPPVANCMLTSGSSLTPTNVTNPCFGLNSGIQSVSFDGLRCIAQGVLRHGVRPSDVNGEVGVTTLGWGFPNGFFQASTFLVGETRHFQIIHRDDPSAVCSSGQNTTQAVSVTFSL